MQTVMLQGQAAVSGFRLEGLRRELAAAAGERRLGDIAASYVYFLQPSDRAGLPDETMARARALLGASGPFSAGEGFLVTPRKGTISPWSSKATDIFRNCGLAAVRRVERGIHYLLRDTGGRVLGPDALDSVLPLLHDRMTEGVYLDAGDIFDRMDPVPCRAFPVLERGRAALDEANARMGLALSDDEIEYLCEAYRAIRRDPTDVELVMFGQVNSEHCRHKIFNADWTVDGRRSAQSLFSMIRNTHETHPAGTLVAYRDNAAVAEGFEDDWFEVARDAACAYRYARTQIDLVMKVETHNHPTAISPYPGAATGAGGEIRDESATGTGGKSKAGLCGFMVSNLRIPGFAMPWEQEHAEFPARLATPLRIMTEGPIGGAGFGNEFGRPQLTGLFKTFEDVVGGRYRGYHKPIMLAGGMGNIKRMHAQKKDIPPGALIIQIGGPAMKIGLGGGAASSMATGSNVAELDFDSVQRDNAEMERRCQEVIDACIALGEGNPILSIHDLGAGGLSNGCPELVSETGGRFELRDVPSEDSSMSPMEIWCCEAQERYVLAILAADLDRFMELCRRERCPAAVIGAATGDGHLSLSDKHFANKPIDIDINVILGRPPKMLRNMEPRDEPPPALDLAGVAVKDAAGRVLRLPAVADKTFLITIADRSVTGLVARDQMVGPYQAPLADVAVTATSFHAVTGEAMAMGERTNVALIDAPASGRLAVGEALTNIAAADIGPVGNVKLSANWMCACGEEGEDANLYRTVRAVGLELCPALGVSIPVGKDSLSMRTVWESSDGTPCRMTAPLSLVVSAFAPVRDVRKTLTPDIKPGDSALVLLDLGAGRNRLGGSALAQVYNQVGRTPPDLDDPGLFGRFFAAVQALAAGGLLLAYHDRSDGGLFATLAEMAIGGRSGMDIRVPGAGDDPLAALFAEELGAVVQVAADRLETVLGILGEHDLGDVTHVLGRTGEDGELVLRATEGGDVLYRERVLALREAWSDLTWQMQARRDNPACVREEQEGAVDPDDPGMTIRLTFEPDEEPEGFPAANASTARPRMAILREQGINGQVEMAAAFDRAGFDCRDVHMTDLLDGRTRLEDFAGLVACGGFSYGDVLGAGSGWARSILYNEALKEMFARFFAREDTFALGVCNGCQMVSQLREIIPGSEAWPMFSRNRCEQFEARYVTVEITPSPSILFRGMAGARLGVAVAHGEGRADFERAGDMGAAEDGGLVAVRYVDGHGRVTERYPLNPNGSPGGITGLTTADGRVTVMMPHPERGFRSAQMSYRPPALFAGEAGPWLRIFQNARVFAG